MRAEARIRMAFDLSTGDLAKANEIVYFGKSLAQRGLAHGASGNLSARAQGCLIVTPSGVALADLEASGLSILSPDGALLGGPSPTKESALHVALYGGCPSAAAVVHLHSHFATAVACLVDLDPTDALPNLTPYFQMRVGKCMLIDQFWPGDASKASVLLEHAGGYRAFLLANHGILVHGASIANAVEVAEEVEATSRLYLQLRGMPYNLFNVPPPDSV